MKYLLFFSVVAIFSYSASAQRDDFYYLQKQINPKAKRVLNFKESEGEASIIKQNNTSFFLENGSEVSLLKQDNMPCIKPDMSQFNMPCVIPKKQTYNMPVLKGNEKNGTVYIFKDGKIISQRAIIN